MNVLTVPVDLGGIWHLTLFLGLGVCAALVMPRSLPLSARLLWLYCLTNALRLVEFPGLPFGDYTRAFQATAGQTLAELLLIPLAVMGASFGTLRRVCMGVTVVECALLVSQGTGLMIAPSFDTAVIALCLPFVPWWMGLPALAMIFTHHGSTALLIFGAQLVAVLARGGKRWLIPVAAAGLACLAWHHANGPWLDGTERIQRWARYAGWFRAQGWNTQLFGTGPGTFMWLGLMIDQFQPPLFLAMHNDWLQIAFELGAFGFCLACYLCGVAVRRAWENPTLLAGLAGVMAFGLTYHPLRFFPSVLVIALIFRRALIVED